MILKERMSSNVKQERYLGRKVYEIKKIQMIIHIIVLKNTGMSKNRKQKILMLKGKKEKSI